MIHNYGKQPKLEILDEGSNVNVICQENIEDADSIQRFFNTSNIQRQNSQADSLVKLASARGVLEA